MKTNQDIISALKILNEYCFFNTEKDELFCSKNKNDTNSENNEKSVVDFNNNESAEQKLERLKKRILDYSYMLTVAKSSLKNYKEACLEEDIKYKIGIELQNILGEFENV